MADSTTPPSNEFRFRNNFFLVGCLANLLVFAVLIVTCGVFFFAISRTLDQSEPAVDERAIHQVLDDQDAAWNRGDLDGFMDGYWHSNELSFTSGDKVETGWDRTRKRYLDKYWAPGMTQRERGKLTFEKLTIEPLELHGGTRSRKVHSHSRPRHGSGLRPFHSGVPQVHGGLEDHLRPHFGR